MPVSRKTVVIGSNGQLGSELVTCFQTEDEVIGLTHKDIEISNLEHSLNLMRQIKPDVIISTAAFHNVPKCEENPVLAFKVNALGALNLARIAEELNAILINYSTDYVFDGSKRKPYLESDMTNPLNIYAITKQDGEYLVRNNSTRHYIIRISGIYGSVPCRAKGGNFITTMLKAAKDRDIVKVVDDEILSPTAVSEIARNTKILIEKGPYGLYHMTCEGACSWYEFACVIFDKLQLPTPLQACTGDEFPSPVLRPSYSVLENSNLVLNSINHMRHWKETVITFLEKNYS